jgi:hypothetical protein
MRASRGDAASPGKIGPYTSRDPNLDWARWQDYFAGLGEEVGSDKFVCDVRLFGPDGRTVLVFPFLEIPYENAEHGLVFQVSPDGRYLMVADDIPEALRAGALETDDVHSLLIYELVCANSMGAESATIRIDARWRFEEIGDVPFRVSLSAIHGSAMYAWPPEHTVAGAGDALPDRTCAFRE